MALAVSEKEDNEVGDLGPKMIYCTNCIHFNDVVKDGTGRKLHGCVQDCKDGMFDKYEDKRSVVKGNLTTGNKK